MASKAIGFLNFKFGADLSGFQRALKKAQKGLKKFGKWAKQTGQNLSRNLTLPIVALGGVALKTFADFEQGMLKVKAISGATTSEFKALTDSAKELGSTTMFTASQVAELQLNLSKLGFNPQSILDSSEAILNLAQATDSDLAEAATVAASTMNAFGLEAKDMTMISDVMADSFSSSALDLQKFQTAMASVAPVANQAGADIQRTSAILGVLVNNGIEASTAGTALRNVFIELAIRGKTWDEAMNEITSDVEPLAKAYELFGKKGASVATIIAGNSTEIQNLTADFQDSAGEAQRMAQIMDSGVGGAFRRLQSQLEGANIELGEKLVPIFMKVTEKIKSLIKWFTDLDSEQQKNIVKWGLIVAAIGPVLIIFGTLSLALAAIATPIGIVTAAIATFTAAFIYLKTSTSNIAISIRNTFKSMANAIINNINNIIVAFNKVSDFVNANPVGLISYFELEEKSSGSGSSAMFDYKKRWEDLKKRGDLAVQQAKLQLELNKLVKTSTKGLTTETKMYSEALETVSTDFLYMASSAEDQFKGMLFWTQELTEAQKAHNATVVLLEDIMFSAAMSAANSQQKFFDSFIENIKQAIKQLLIQLAVLTVISLLLGGPTMSIGKAFSFAKGKVLGLEGFADGGLVYGPTTALIGEGVGTTASNPEVVAPLDKLKQYMGGGNQNIIVEGVLKGNDIYLSNRNTSINRFRTT